MVGEAGEAVPAQDVADRRARHPDERRQPVGTDAMGVAGGEDRVHVRLGQRPRRASWPRGAAREPGLALGLEPTQPIPGSLAADPGHVGGMRDCHPVDEARCAYRAHIEGEALVGRPYPGT